MDGPLQLSGPLRPVPIYCRRPLELELSPSNPLHSPTLQTSPGATEKVKETTRPTPSHQAPLPSPMLPPPPSLVCKGALLSPFGKTRELSPMDKNGVPLITPVRGPDPRSVALYQSLLRQHPAYHQLLETFLLPPLPPLLCHPAAALCDTPFAFCAAPLPTPASLAEEERRRVTSSEAAQAKDWPARIQGRISEPPSPADWPARIQGRASESQSPAEGKSGGGAVVSAEELVSSITAIPDPYQQYGYGRKLFPCPQCRYTTDRRNNLKRHMLTMHQLSAKMLECCGVLFRTKAALREHALIFHYHGYTCFYCGRRFCRKALLKRHLSVHNGQKEFICNVCDYATSHKSNLERHRRVHMRQDDDISCTDDQPSENPREISGHVSEDEISVCSHDEESEEINVHSD